MDTHLKFGVSTQNPDFLFLILSLYDTPDGQALWSVNGPHKELRISGPFEITTVPAVHNAEGEVTTPAVKLPDQFFNLDARGALADWLQRDPENVIDEVEQPYPSDDANGDPLPLLDRTRITTLDGVQFVAKGADQDDPRRPDSIDLAGNLKWFDRTLIATPARVFNA